MVLLINGYSNVNDDLLGLGLRFHAGTSPKIAERTHKGIVGYAFLHFLRRTFRVCCSEKDESLKCGIKARPKELLRKRHANRLVDRPKLQNFFAMPLYEMTSDAFRPLSQASFADIRIRERNDLQRLLRSQIDVLGDELYVLTEEFGEWEDSRRRIDLLAIDPQANLVVIELKRTSDGGHNLLKVDCRDCLSGVFAPQLRADTVHECSVGILRMK
jgi:hypothetical protein